MTATRGSWRGSWGAGTDVFRSITELLVVDSSSLSESSWIIGMVGLGRDVTSRWMNFLVKPGLGCLLKSQLATALA
jgi:hypothetical protein